jgi:hypothetical protein
MLRNFLFPAGGRTDEGYFAYRCTMLGLRFDLFLGRFIPDFIRSMCILRSAAHPIFLTEMVDESALVDFGKLMTRSQVSPKLRNIGRG